MENMKMENRKRGGWSRMILTALLSAVLCIGMSVAVYADTDTYLSSCAVTGTGDYTGYHAEVNGNTVIINALYGYRIDANTKVTLNGKSCTYSKKVTNTVENVDYFYFTAGSSDDAKDDDDEEDHEPPSWVKNPNQKPALVMSAPALGGGFTLGWQEQGELGKLAFSMARPAGWSEAFSFNVLKGGKPDTSLKAGTLTMNIPSQYLKTGRQFALLAIETDGTVKTYVDSDNDPSTITISLNGTAYAFDLIYFG